MIAALPGIREIRSALAGGYLWLFLFWLLLDPSLGEADFAAEPYQSAHHLGELLGPVALGVATTFAAYLLGTFVNEGRNVMSRLYLYARQSENFTPDVARSRLSQRLDNRRNALVRRRLRRIKRKSYTRKAFERSWIFTHYRAAAVPSYVVKVPVAFMAVFERLSSFTASLADSLGFAFALPLIVLEVAGLALLRSIIAMRAEPYKPFLTRRGVSALETYLESLAPSGTDGVLPGVADVISDFSVIRTRLIHASVDTVSEVDRLAAEAEFRSAIVAPLILVVGLLAIDTSLWWLLLWPMLLTLLSAARERRRESGDLLVDALCQDVVTSPSIDAFSSSKQAGHATDGAAQPSSGRDLIW
jgi:hypothetical protein